MSSLKLRKFFISITILLAVLLGVNLLIFAGKKMDDDYFKADFNKNYRIYSLVIPSKLDFAGEAVPLNKFDVRESLDREMLLNTYWQSQSILMHKRAYRWFKIILPILKKNQIPEDFKYVAMIESGFTNAVSPSGASGFWQFLDKTGLHYGLTVNTNVDERYHVEKATEAACKYFKEAYAKFGNWTMVAASYNMGITGIYKQSELQKTNTYYDLLLNQETGRYVYRILALKEIIEHPAKYGFIIRKKDIYPAVPFQKVKIDSTISNLVNFAETVGTNYKVLKLLNPWLRENSLDNKEKRTYEIEVPVNNFDQAMLEEIYNGNELLSANNELKNYPLESTVDSLEKSKKSD